MTNSAALGNSYNYSQSNEISNTFTWFNCTGFFGGDKDQKYLQYVKVVDWRHEIIHEKSFTGGTQAPHGAMVCRPVSVRLDAERGLTDLYRVLSQGNSDNQVHIALERQGENSTSSQSDTGSAAKKDSPIGIYTSFKFGKCHFKDLIVDRDSINFPNVIQPYATLFFEAKIHAVIRDHKNSVGENEATKYFYYDFNLSTTGHAAPFYTDHSLLVNTMEKQKQ